MKITPSSCYLVCSVPSSAMEIPPPFVSGTVVYLMLTVLAMASGIVMGITGKLNRENAQYVSQRLILLIELID